MASTQVPVTFSISSPDGGKLVWTPAEHGQKHLRELYQKGHHDKIGQIHKSLEQELNTLPGLICVVVHPELIDEARAALALMALLGLGPDDLLDGENGFDNTFGPEDPDLDAFDD